MTTDWIRNKRVLVAAPDFYDWDLGSYVAKILARKGADVETFGYSRLTPAMRQRRLLDACGRIRPHLLLGLKLDGIEAATLRRIKRIGARVALWYVDCLARTVPDWIKPVFREADIFFTSAKGLLPAYASIAPTPAYWMVEGAYLPAFRPAVPPTPADRRLFGSTVAFVGSVYHPSPDQQDFRRRERLFRQIGRRYALTIWGLQHYPVSALTADKRCRVVQWPAYHQDLVRICRNSAVVLGINFINSIELYFSSRTYLTLAAGGFHLTHYVPKLETMFRNHEHLVWFHSTGECLDLLDFYLKRPRARRAIAIKGQRHVRTHYAMTSQVSRMVEIIGAHHGHHGHHG